MIPCYNGEQYIHECLDKILKQDCTNVEILIVNDGSKDNSPQILEEYSKKHNCIKLINQENAGIAKTRNILLDNVTGKYLYFLDIDDYLSDDFIEVFNKNKDSNVDIMVAKTKVIRRNKVMKFYMTNNAFDKIEKPTDYLKFNALFPWNKFFRREFVLESKVRFSEATKNFEDIGTIPFFFAKAKSMKLIDDFLYHYRYMNGLSKSKNITIDSTQDIFYQLNYAFEKLETPTIDWYIWINDCFSPFFSLIHYQINFVLKINKEQAKMLIKKLKELQERFYVNESPEIFWKKNFYNLCKITGLK